MNATTNIHTQTTKHFLIVDDEFGIAPETLFKQEGLNVEVVVVPDRHEALRQLELWKAKGARADIIAMDLEFGKANSVCNDIDQWLKHNPALKPEKCFIQSQTPDKAQNFIDIWNEAFSRLGKLSAIDTQEYSDITSLGSPFYNTQDCYDNTLRTYLNRHWATSYPISDEEFAQLAEKNAFISSLQSPDQAWKKVQSTEVDRETALRHMRHADLRELLSPQIDHSEIETSCGFFDQNISKSLAGYLAFSDGDVAQLKAQGKKVILVLQDYNADQIARLNGVDGVILIGSGTEHLKGVLQSYHIAGLLGGQGRFHIKAKGNSQTLVFDGDDQYSFRPPAEFHALEPVTLYQSVFFPGIAPIMEHDISKMPWLQDVMQWAQEVSAKHGGMRVGISANTDSNVKEAVTLGADGIGLLRTEHTFFSAEGLHALRNGLLNPDAGKLDEIKRVQKNALMGAFEAAASAGRNFPVTIRLLDAPPAEFLRAEDMPDFLQRVGGKANARGVQLALRTPGLYKAQAKAIFETAKDAGYLESPGIMVPLVRNVQELKDIRKEIDAAARETGFKKPYRFGAMLETVQACAPEEAKKIAAETDFLSIGPKDLTIEITGVHPQQIDAAKEWMNKNDCYGGDTPFGTLVRPVQRKIEQAIAAVREAKDQPVTLCADDIANDRETINFCQSQGLYALSAPPDRAIFSEARLLAAQAALNHPNSRQLSSHLNRTQRSGTAGIERG